MSQQLFIETDRDRQAVAETDRIYQTIQAEHGDCVMCEDGTAAMMIHPSHGPLCASHWLVVARHEAL